MIDVETRNTLCDAVQAELDNLPDEPDDIARRLQELGYDYCGGSSDNCPIALYLTDRVGVPIRAYPTYLIVGEDAWYDGSMYDGVGSPYGIDMDLPSKVRDFIRRYDNGMYPFLKWWIQGGQHV